MSKEPKAKRNRSRTMMIAVVGLFAAPILIAWVLVRSGSPIADRALLNHGQLLTPPLDIRNDAALEGLNELSLAPGEWSILYFAAARCSEPCESALEVLRAIREVIGQDATRVRIAAVVDEGAVNTPLGFVLSSRHARQRLTEYISGRVGGPATQGVVFLDWRGQIMMYYPDVSTPQDIKSDIKRLLRASRIK